MAKHIHLFVCLTTLTLFIKVSQTSSLPKFSNLLCFTGLYECCDAKWLKLDTNGLEKDLKLKLHGQHLVSPIVVNAIRAHVKDENSQKPLVFSFHGWRGGGKTFVSQMIARNLYEKGESSKFVHIWHSDLHFRDENKVKEYKDQLQSWIHHNVSSCGRSLFIFEGMEYMPEGIIDAVSPFLGHNTYVNGVDFRKNIFIFISNVGGKLITKTAFEHHNNGKQREDLKFRDFQKPLEEAASKLLGGLKGSDILERQLIDHFVPFLPLEQTHVKECIKDEYNRMSVAYTDTKINKVMEELDWWPENENIYCKSGCTKVTNKVKLHSEI